MDDEQTALLPVTTLAKNHGQLLASPDGEPAYRAPHMAAAVLNGWNAYERLLGEQPKLGADVYLAALEAAKLGKPHEPATVHVKGEE
jgi:hypothetical protein